MKIKTKVGDMHSRLTVIKLVGSVIKGSGELCWLCRCVCGKEVVIRGSSLRSGTTRSCGCFQRDELSLRRKSHGMSGTPEYKAWSSMKERIYLKTNASYKRYGGRGIKCLWNNFDEFYKDMGDRPSANHSIDRIDNNGHYCKENCRWATKKEQARNTRRNVYYEYKGDRMLLPQFAEKYGVPIKTLKNRIKRYQDIGKAITFKVKNYRLYKGRYEVRVQRDGEVIYGGKFEKESDAIRKVKEILKKK